MKRITENVQVFGIMAEFNTPGKLVDAARKASAAGYRNMDAYTPIPIEELTDALGFRHTRLPLFVLCCAILGCLVGFFMQYYIATTEYPLNIGGRPLNSWPQFIPITFEMTILFAAIGAVVGMFLRNGLPKPVHPVFNLDRFEGATRDKFFLCIESSDPSFDNEKTRRFLETLKPSHISIVEQS